MFDNMLGRVAETVVMGLFETTDEELTEMHRYGRLGLQISVNYQNVQELAAKAEELTGSHTPAPQPMAPRSNAGGGARRPASAKRSGPSLDEPAAAKTVTVDKVGRNDPCPCGSGKKYKVCCGRG
ncbi:MAG: SEC-C domain-containing protein [Armatimonadetes bacterium]|nr:SEC-C domain-containing protein [Armatimonadota bacterium]